MLIVELIESRSQALQGRSSVFPEEQRSKLHPSASVFHFLVGLIQYEEKRSACTALRATAMVHAPNWAIAFEPSATDSVLVRSPRDISYIMNSAWRSDDKLFIFPDQACQFAFNIVMRRLPACSISFHDLPLPLISANFLFAAW